MIPSCLIVLCLGLTIISLIWKLFPLMIVASLAWFGAGATFLGAYTAGEIEWVIGPVSMLAGVYCIVHALWLIPRGKQGPPPESEQEAYKRKVLNATRRK